MATVTDGNGNVTTQGYDGLDRRLTTTYSGGSYEQLGYNTGSNVTSRPLRDGQSIGYTYDALGRVVAKDRPNGVYWEMDQSYGYDNLGRLTGRRTTVSATAAPAKVWRSACSRSPIRSAPAPRCSHRCTS